MSLDNYEIVSEHVPSRVVMLAKKKFKRNDGWYTWIDFPKFDRLYAQYLNAGIEFNTDDYLVRTPSTGLSGKKTQDNTERTREIRAKKAADVEAKLKENPGWAKMYEATRRGNKKADGDLGLSGDDEYVDEETDELSFLKIKMSNIFLLPSSTYQK